MIISTSKGSVGKWIFEGGIVEQLSPSTLRATVESIASVLSVLEANRLLFPNRVRVSQWMRSGDRDVIGSERIEKADIEIIVGQSSVFDDIYSVCDSIMKLEAVYPLTIEVLGKGTIVTADGDLDNEEIVWVRANTLEILRIIVATQSDAWLPFTLAGDAQPEIHNLNANRLTHALEEIRKRTGFNLEVGVETDFAVMDGLHLQNVRYVDGTVVDVS